MKPVLALHGVPIEMKWLSYIVCGEPELQLCIALASIHCCRICYAWLICVMLTKITQVVNMVDGESKGKNTDIIPSMQYAKAPGQVGAIALLAS